MPSFGNQNKRRPQLRMFLRFPMFSYSWIPSWLTQCLHSPHAVEAPRYGYYHRPRQLDAASDLGNITRFRPIAMPCIWQETANHYLHDHTSTGPWWGVTYSHWAMILQHLSMDGLTRTTHGKRPTAVPTGKNRSQMAKSPNCQSLLFTNHCKAWLLDGLSLVEIDGL